MSNSKMTAEREDEECSLNTPKKFRVQLDFPAQDFEEINAMVAKLGLSSRAELFRSALIALRWICNKKAQNCTIVAITPDHRYLEPEFEFLQRQGQHESDRRKSAAAYSHGSGD
jgi:hypothetical protein